MHPLSRPTPTIQPTLPSKEQAKKAVAEALDGTLPTDLAGIVSDYFYDDVDVELATRFLRFDGQDNVSNPEVRVNIKRALLSPTCPPEVKAKIFQNFRKAIDRQSGESAKIYRLELEKISDEILEEGGVINLQGVYLAGVILSVNLRKADLTAAHISETEIWSDCTQANLTNSLFEYVGFQKAKLCLASTAGLKIVHSSFIDTEVTGMTLTDPALIDLRSDQAKTKADGVQETVQVLNGVMSNKKAPRVTGRCLIM